MDVPEGWISALIGDVARIQIGRTPARKVGEYWDTDRVTENRWASISDLSGKWLSETKERISDRAVAECRPALVPAGTPLMSFKLTIGRVARAARPLYTNEAIAAFLPKNDSRADWDPEFLFYALPAAAKTVRSDQAVKGATLNKAKMREMVLRLPPLPEQRKIAEILGSVDEAIQATQAVIDQTRKVKQGLLQQLLTRGIGHTRFKQTEIGEIPESWEVATVGEACTIRNNLRKPIRRADRDAMQGPYPYYGPTKVLSRISEYRFDGRYVLIGEDGDHFLKFATWSMTQLVKGRFNVNNHAHAIESNERCAAEWFYQFFRHRDLTPRLTRQGAGRYKLKKATLVELRIALPPRAEQLAIHEVVLSFDRSESAGAEEVASLVRYKAAAAGDLLSGRVRVKVPS